MKRKLLLSLTILLGLILNAFSQEIMEVPLSLASGYSLFQPSMVNLRAETEKSTFKVNLTGIPENLKSITRHQLIADEKQFWHQNYINGNMPKELYEQRMEFLKYDPGKDEISETPLRCFVYIVVGEDGEGNKVWLADTDLDLDFSDEEARPLFSYSPPLDFEKYKQFADNSIQLKYQRVLDGKVVEEEFPFAVAFRDSMNLLFNYPIHYLTTIKVDNKAYIIAIESGGFLSRGLEETNNRMIVVTDKDKQKSVEHTVPVPPNQYFHLGEDVYQYLGIDAAKKTARIKRVKDVEVLKSAQIGFTSPDFQGKDFKTGEAIAMDQFKGKYILLDFWATWCGPCIEEFPRLKALTSQYEESKFEIVGIIGDSKPETVEKLIDKYGLSWYQILSDEIVEQYGVLNYPATFLISPEGKILHKDLRGEELEKVIAGLIKKKL
jgi:peroxiredoxin